MKEFKTWRRHRWLIWTIVLATALLVSLAVYIYHSSFDDSAWAEGFNFSRSRSLAVQDLLNTFWVPEGGQDALLAFYGTKRYDLSGASYDYSYASDSQMRELGYWRISGQNIYLTPTQVLTYPSSITKISRQGNTLLFYVYSWPEPMRFVRYEE